MTIASTVPSAVPPEARNDVVRRGDVLNSQEHRDRGQALPEDTTEIVHA